MASRRASCSAVLMGSFRFCGARLISSLPNGVETRDFFSAMRYLRSFNVSMTLARVASVPMPFASFSWAFASSSDTKRWTLAIASISVPSVNFAGGEVFFFWSEISRHLTTWPFSRSGRDDPASSSSSSFSATVQSGSRIFLPLASQMALSRETVSFCAS